MRNWTVVRGLLGEAWGSSGSIQVPERIIAGLDSDQIPLAVPGTRRSGGHERHRDLAQPIHPLPLSACPAKPTRPVCYAKLAKTV